MTAIRDQIDVLIPAGLCDGDAKCQPALFDAGSLLDVQHVFVELPIESRDVVDLIR
eukprot:CAMPEP_0170421312 /NCGR_PEP_ID=MMETSP0117_2-20130122/35828_1 /TAXON_ID=400756 /ORGANISM="Durinskia baltica, Strain CSIRO CS-38" /LENGTH=55 /DNA_ID=CAMNT_0010679847 /DNA_START=503 /DNA_END=666 /DNA_ORIENTATION=-